MQGISLNMPFNRKAVNNLPNEGTYFSEEILQHIKGCPKRWKGEQTNSRLARR